MSPKCSRSRPKRSPTRLQSMPRPVQGSILPASRCFPVLTVLSTHHSMHWRWVHPIPPAHPECGGAQIESTSHTTHGVMDSHLFMSELVGSVDNVSSPLSSDFDVLPSSEGNVSTRTYLGAKRFYRRANEVVHVEAFACFKYML